MRDNEKHKKEKCIKTHKQTNKIDKNGTFWRGKRGD